MAFDKYSELDPAKMQRDIEEDLGYAIFDKYSILDDVYRVQQIETAYGIEISNDALLDPTRLMQEIVAGSGDADWVPVGAKIFIDFVNNIAWSEADGGEIAINMLLGTDPNTVNGWSATEYDPDNLTVDGYVSATPVALIGAARTMVFADCTFVVKFKPDAGNAFPTFTMLSADGDAGVSFDVLEEQGQVNIASFVGSTLESILDVVNADSLNVIAGTITTTRADVACNGSDAVTTALSTADYPVSGPSQLVAALVGLDDNAIQSITIYDALPDTAGLSELSAV